MSESPNPLLPHGGYRKLRSYAVAEAVYEALVPKLPDRLTDKQKQRKAHNLLQELRRSGSIANQGTRSHPEWVIVEPPSD
jgi:ATP-dependent DNA helicase RecG